MTLYRKLLALPLLGLTLLATSMLSHAMDTPVLMVFGDSLSAGYGLAQKDGWVSLLGKKLEQNKLDYKLVNASISGETTHGGATRINAALKQHKPAVIVVELGGNDGLRGLPLSDSKANLEKIILASKKQKAKILLVGMQLPPNYGPDYTEKFHAMYGELAAKHQTALVPFMLAGVTDSRDNFQADNIHPVAKVQPRMLDNIWAALLPLLNKK
jgi:acyl-CoA thioesterase I